MPFEPNRYSIANLVKALAAVTHHKPLDPPTWVDGNGLVSASELVPCRNGLFHVPTRHLHAHTPAFFNLTCAPVDYEPAAPPPQRWLKFLAELWPDDPESIDDPTSIETFQEIFDYLLSGDTTQQKLFLGVGPRRSGKGTITIASILTRLVGPHNGADQSSAQDVSRTVEHPDLNHRVGRAASTGRLAAARGS